jgi:hypothetical protein
LLSRLLLLLLMMMMTVAWLANARLSRKVLTRARNKPSVCERTPHIVEFFLARSWLIVLRKQNAVLWMPVVVMTKDTSSPKRSAWWNVPGSGTHSKGVYLSLSEQSHIFPYLGGRSHPYHDLVSVGPLNRDEFANGALLCELC